MPDRELLPRLFNMNVGSHSNICATLPLPFRHPGVAPRGLPLSSAPRLRCPTAQVLCARLELEHREQL